MTPASRRRSSTGSSHIPCSAIRSHTRSTRSSTPMATAGSRANADAVAPMGIVAADGARQIVQGNDPKEVTVDVADRKKRHQQAPHHARDLHQSVRARHPRWVADHHIPGDTSTAPAAGSDGAARRRRWPSSGRGSPPGSSADPVTWSPSCRRTPAETQRAGSGTDHPAAATGVEPSWCASANSAIPPVEHQPSTLDSTVIPCPPGTGSP